MEDVRIRANATLYGFGQAIGHTIFATVPREQYSEYTQPFSEIHHSMRHGIEVAYAEVVELNDGVAHV
ncbi:MAG TPA: hypothetical protein VLF88_00685 [Candidatus Babeliales bacterium]|nr:hypothetical protein [Candidatus Babeliales bacterium]